MGAVEITLVSFIALMSGLAGSCILTFVLKRSEMVRGNQSPLFLGRAGDGFGEA